MRRLVALALCAMLLSWNLSFSLTARADDDRDRRDDDDSYKGDPAAKYETKTPIKHVVVIFDENISFDHYFATYPNATPNLDPTTDYFGKPKDDTPWVNGLTPTLLSNNPNFLSGGSNPFRLDRSLALTCNNNNGYKKEQQAFDGGLLDKFSITSVAAQCANPMLGGPLPFFTPNLAMGYYDGNTVTALWNYARYYAMSDNFFDTLFGTTVMGHMNLLSGQTNGLDLVIGGTYASPTINLPVTLTSSDVAGTISNNSIIANVEPFYDDCATANPPHNYVRMKGTNVGNLLNAAGVSWGWFYGDFKATSAPGVFPATCTPLYNSHYDPFDYYPSTANPHHIAPTPLSAVGRDSCNDFSCANHNYDLQTFYDALGKGNLPAVTYLKFAETDTGHASDSTPLEEQTQLVKAINAIEQSPFWQDTAIMITYDDTGGWYDHVAGPIVNFSQDAANDAITPGSCGKLIVKGMPAVPSPNDRCGFGVRMPFLLISPYAKQNYVDHSLNDTTSILRFIEYNWSLGTIPDLQSFDKLTSGSILGMLDFDDEHHGHDNREIFLDQSTGVRIGGGW